MRFYSPYTNYLLHKQEIFWDSNVISGVVYVKKKKKKDLSVIPMNKPIFYHQREKIVDFDFWKSLPIHIHPFLSTITN